MKPVFLLALPLVALLSIQHARAADNHEKFVLPTGDAARGKQAFVKLGCGDCHRVHGVNDIPLPKVKPPVPLLGGHVRSAPTDADLVAAILNPSNRITKTLGATQTAQPDGSSRMPDFSEKMTARELIDIVAFLHSRDWRELQK